MGRTADAIAEGVTIADAAARLAIRNHVLVSTIGRDGPFDLDAARSFARETLNGLAEEQEQAATLLRQLRRHAGGQYSMSESTHDYRDRDRRNLRRRARQSRGVAKRVRELAADPAQVDGLIERARRDAWGDVAANLERRLSVEGMRPDSDPDYASLREARMDALRLIDLQRLAVRARRRDRNG